MKKNLVILTLMLFFTTNISAMLQGSDTPESENETKKLKSLATQKQKILQKDTDEEPSCWCALLHCCFQSLGNLQPQTAYSAPTSRFYRYREQD